MQITSNNSILLEEFYNQLKRERIKVELKNEQIENAMGVMPTIEIKSSDFTTMIRDMFRDWMEYKKFKVYVDSKEVNIEEFNKINKDTKIDIEFEEK